MRRKLRYIPPNSLVEVTAKTIQDRYLLRPGSEMNRRFIGVMARAKSFYDVRVHSVSVMSNHWHGLVSPADAERVERHHRQARQPVEGAKVLLKLSAVSHARERPREAVQRVERALDVLDLEEEPVLQLVARHNLMAFLLECNELREARAVFDELPETEDRLLGLRRSWLEGELLRAEGDLGGAAERYDATRVGYLAPDAGGPRSSPTSPWSTRKTPSAPPGPRVL